MYMYMIEKAGKDIHVHTHKADSYKKTDLPALSFKAQLTELSPSIYMYFYNMYMYMHMHMHMKTVHSIFIHFSVVGSRRLVLVPVTTVAVVTRHLSLHQQPQQEAQSPTQEKIETCFSAKFSRHRVSCIHETNILLPANSP